MPDSSRQRFTRNNTQGQTELECTPRAQSARFTATVQSAEILASGQRLWLFQGPLEASWAIKRPVILIAEQDEDGEYIITDSFSTVFGNGKTLRRAIADYCDSLISYYEILESHARGNLQNSLQLRSLQKYVTNTKPKTPAHAHQAERPRKGPSV